MPGSLSPQQRPELLKLLSALPPTQFDQLVFDMRAPSGLIPGNSAPQSNRSTALLEWVEGPTGPGLSSLKQILEQIAPAGPELNSQNTQTDRALTEILKFLKENQSPKYDLREAQFGGGFAETVQGDQIGTNQQAQAQRDVEKLIKSSVKNLVKWTPFIVGLGVTSDSLASHQWTQAVMLLSLIAIGSSIWVKFSGTFMEEIEKDAEKQGGGLARWMIAGRDRTAIALKEKTLSTWRYLTSDFEDKYYQRLTYRCRNYETQGLDKDQVLKLQQVFVPLKISPESLVKISQDLIQSSSKKELSKRQEIGQFLARMESDPAFRRLAILGAPGSGKTTLLRYLTLIYTNRQQRKLLHPKATSYIPVLMYLRDVRGEIVTNPKLPLVDLIHSWLQGLQTIDPLTPPPNWFANKLKRNQCLILLDGLDEIADEAERQKVSQWVDFQMKEYPETPFILSSRPLGYKSAKLQQDVTVLKVQPFNFGQVVEFIHNWYLETEIKSQGNNDDLGVQEDAKQQADDLVKRIRNSAPLTTMAVNPLLLTMIATVHRRGSALPGKRVELYKEICQVLLEKRQIAKGLEDTLTGSQKLSVLKPLAFTLMEDKKRSFSLTPEVDRLLQEKLELLSSKIPISNEFLEKMREVSGLLIAKEEGVYEFAHLSFQEYLASVEIKESNNEARLTSAIESPEQFSWWAETIRLYCAQNDASSIIQAALKSDNIDTLSLASDCLEEGLSVQRSIRQTLETLLVQGLESDDIELFKVAAEVKLSRRLKQLLRVDEKIAIDTDYITCAEYQLFIDEQRQQQNYYQPDHWEEYHFSSGTATTPITGIRAKDAQTFCDWLSLRTGQSYRLPYVQEAQDHPLEKFEIAVWSLGSNSNEYELVGVPGKQWQQWQITLSNSLSTLFQQDLARDLALSLALEFTLDLDLDRALSLTRTLDPACDRALALARAQALNLDLARTRDLDSARVRALALNLDLARDLLNLARDLDRGIDRNLDRGIDLDLARTRDLACNLDLTRANVRTYLNSFLTALELLIETYEQYLNRQIFRDNNRFKRYNRDKNDLIQQLSTTAESYLAFAMLHLRQENKLPAWESIRIVREES